MKYSYSIILLFLSLIACNQKSYPVIENEEGLKEINGTQLFVKVIGTGEPILVVHGGPGLDHSYFLPQLTDLAKENTLIFYDQRASGKSSSDLDSSQVSMDIFIEDIEEIRRNYGIEKLNLLGHSWGGLLAMKYAVKHSDKLKTLILSNSSSASGDYMAQAAQRQMERTTEEDRLEQQTIMASEEFAQGKASAYNQLFRSFFRREFVDKSLVEELNLNLPETFRANSQVLGYLRKDLPGDYEFHNELSAIQCPTLIIYGDYEPLASISTDNLKASIPNSELQLIEGCGHFPFIEKPEIYFTSIKSFIKRQ